MFIPGNGSVNSKQVGQKLQFDGWSNIEITRKGQYDHRDDRRAETEC
jgi:hypothetical protein